MASRSTIAARPNLLPPGFIAFLHRRLVELGGIALVIVTAFLVLAVASFDPADPSLNTATARAPANLAGLPGAYVADFMLQSVGVAAIAVAATLLAWGWRFIAHRSLGHILPRLGFLVGAMVAAAIGFAALPVPAAWPVAGGLGGAVGATIFDLLVPYVALIGGNGAALAIAAFAVSLIALAPALGLDTGEWRALAHGCSWAATLPLRGVAAARRLAGTGGGGFGALLGRRGKAHPHRHIEPRIRGTASIPAAASDRVRVPPRAAADKPDAGPRQRLSAKIVSRRTGRRAARQERLDLVSPGEYQFPPLNLLTLPPDHAAHASDNEEALAQNARLLEAVLDDFGVNGEIVKVHPGPVVTLYELEPAPGTKSSRVISLADDIARSMSAISVRVALIPGRSVIGIELPNGRRETVYLREMLASHEYESSGSRIPLSLGKDISGAPVITDLARMPHLLVAGTTGSGKSVAINTMILSLVYRLSPDQCKLILIDPKMLELSVYDGIPHLLTPVVTDPGKAVVALKWAVREMENRYRAMSRLGVRNIAGYNKRLAEAAAKDETLTRSVQTGFHPETGEPVFEEQELPTDPLPSIVIIVDEMADLMLLAGKDVEGAIQRLAQMARAAGIHLVMATQRPSVDVITGTIKANFPTRVSFQVTSKIDSRTILGEQGAEQLLGDGDMLYMSSGGRVIRVHGPFVSDAEVERVAAFLQAQGRPEYIDDVTEEIDFPILGASSSGDDMLYDQAVALVCRERKASTSFVQRHLQIGYNRAARIVERMEAEGVVTKANHVGKREVLARSIEGDEFA